MPGLWLPVIVALSGLRCWCKWQPLLNRISSQDHQTKVPEGGTGFGIPVAPEHRLSSDEYLSLSIKPV